MSGRFGSTNSRGRSSGQYTGRLRKIYGPPKDGPWCWLSREMLESPAWTALSINARKFLDFLCIENMNHAGRENGFLKATYDQLANYGVTRELISSSIDETIALGFVRCGPRLRRIATNYRLTFYGDGNFPTNEWKRTTSEMVVEIKKRISECKADRSRNLVRYI